MQTEKIPSLFFKMAMPAVVAQVINLLYNIVDRMYIGHMPENGSLALTGAGLFMSILMLINAFAMLVASGGAPLAAMYLGQQKKDYAEKIMGNCLTLLIAIAVVLTTVLWIFAPRLLTFFGASSQTLPYALTYSRIYICGTLVVTLTLGMNLFISAQGFAKISMLTTVIGAVTNIILDPILIFGFNMGVAGAAIATVISQTVSCLWILRFLTGKKTGIRLKKENISVIPKVVFPCLALGISTFVMLATESLLSITFSRSLATYGGDIAVGAMTIITSVNSLVVMPLQGMAQGASPIISFNFGAGEKERVKKTFYILLKSAVTYVSVFYLLIMLVPQIFAGMFTPDPELMNYTKWAMRIYFAGTFAMSFQMSCQQSFVALGQASVSLFMACLRKLVLLIPLILILPQFISNQIFAVFLAEPVSDITAALVTSTTFFKRFPKILSQGAKLAEE